jgi:hypothetical protein
MWKKSREVEILKMKLILLEDTVCKNDTFTKRNELIKLYRRIDKV